MVASLPKIKPYSSPPAVNTGISLAFVGGLKGYKVKVVMPQNVSSERSQLLWAYGAEIVFSDGSKGTNGSIEMAQEMMESGEGWLHHALPVRQRRQSRCPL